MCDGRQELLVLWEKERGGHGQHGREAWGERREGGGLEVRVNAFEGGMEVQAAGAVCAVGAAALAALSGVRVMLVLSVPVWVLDCVRCSRGRGEGLVCGKHEGGRERRRLARW